MSLKLTYFDARGRAEVLRLVMAYGKIDYEDVRLQFKDWPEFKPETPWGSVPVLEINGKAFGQGMALSVYLAKKAGLYPDDALEALRVDEIVNAREDLMTAQAKLLFEKDAEKKAELMKKLSEEVFPTILGRMNSRIEENAPNSEWTVGKKMSLADVVIFEGTQKIHEASPEVIDKFPKVKAIREKVAAAEGISQYVAKRGPSMF